MNRVRSPTLESCTKNYREKEAKHNEENLLKDVDFGYHFID